MSKKLAFRLAAILLGLIPLVAIELGLRAVDLGHPDDHDDPFVGFTAVRPLFVLDPTRTRYVIAPSRLRFFRPESFAARKSPREFRIFCLGGSTVQGRPFAIETSFTSWLELSLRAADPSRSWEVVNCGGISYASYRLAPIVDEILGRYEPDLIVLLTGHNEFLERRTYGRWVSLPAPLMAPLGVVSRLRSFVLLRELAAGGRGGATAGPDDRSILEEDVDTILDYRDGLASYHRNEAWRQGVLAHFDDNLGRMIRACQAQGVPILLVNPVANLETPPFKSAWSNGLPDDRRARAESLWERARILYDHDLPVAAELLEEAAAIDPRHAGLQFTLAESLRSLGRFEEALRHFNRAKEEDICPLRILEPLRRIIRTRATTSGAWHVDLAPVFQPSSDHGIYGYDAFLDHVHPSILGHRQIAGAILNLLVDRGIVEPRAGWKREEEELYRRRMESLEPIYFLKAEVRLERLQLWATGRGVRLRDHDPDEHDAQSSIPVDGLESDTPPPAPVGR